jgi:fructose-1,6-bisphosphatase I
VITVSEPLADTSRSDEAPDVVEEIFKTVAAATPDLREAIRGRRGETDETNPSGEAQLEADRWFDRLLATRLGRIDGVGTYASEERDSPVDCGAGLGLTVDPLDGSSNLTSNNLVGTIVGVYDGAVPASGKDLIAAGYVVYGPTTTMVTARDDRVTDYEIVEGERRTLRRDVTLPEDPTVFGFGGGDDEWPPAFARYADDVREALKLRYGGALVGDVNQVLQYGGVFAYPALESRPEGKLRRQFEANPIAYVVEAAGGASSDGDGPILDAEADGLHDRTPLYVGNEALIEQLPDDA